MQGAQRSGRRMAERLLTLFCTLREHKSYNVGHRRKKQCGVQESFSNEQRTGKAIIWRA